MKILKPGKLPGETLHTGHCYTCGCDVEFARNEGTVTADWRRDTSSVMVKCPTEGCGGSIVAAITYASLR